MKALADFVPRSYHVTEMYGPLSLLINEKAKFDQDRFTKKDSLERIMMEKKQKRILWCTRNQDKIKENSFFFDDCLPKNTPKLNRQSSKYAEKNVLSSNVKASPLMRPSIYNQSTLINFISAYRLQLMSIDGESPTKRRWCYRAWNRVQNPWSTSL